MNHQNNSLPPDASGIDPFHIGDWYVQPALNTLSRGGQSIQIEPRIMYLLTCLAADPGKVIGRAALLETIWNGSIVNEEALTKAVSELRHVLGDDPKSPRFIQTIHKGGYRVIAPVSQEHPEAPHQRLSESEDIASAATPNGLSVFSRRGPLTLMTIAVLVILLAALVISIQRTHSAIPPGPIPLEAVPFTSYQGQEICPAISPDGTRIAFSWCRGDKNECDLFVKQENTESPLRLTDMEGDEGYAAWSPDGSSVAFAHLTEDGGIYTVPAIGGSPRKVLDVPEGMFGMDWSPDGRWLVYASRDTQRNQWQLFLYSFATKQVRPLTFPSELYRGDFRPVFSPDSRKVAFVRGDRCGLEDIYIASVEDKHVERVTFSQHSVQGVDWTSDGRHLVFSSGPVSGSECRLWRLALEDGSLNWLLARGQRPRRPSIAVAGRGLVYEEQSLKSDVWRRRIDEPGNSVSPPALLIGSTFNDYCARYSPDGSMIAFISTRSGNPELWTCDHEGRTPRQLTEFGGAYVADPYWSYDGTHIAFTAAPGSYAGAYVVNAQTGGITCLSSPNHHERCLGWSRDGQWLYYKTDRDGTWMIFDEAETIGTDLVLVSDFQ